MSAYRFGNLPDGRSVDDVAPLDSTAAHLGGYLATLPAPLVDRHLDTSIAFVRRRLAVAGFTDEDVDLWADLVVDQTVLRYLEITNPALFQAEGGAP